MATLSNILSFARLQAQTDSNGLSDTNGIIWTNEALFDFHRRLVDAGVDASQLQESYQDGTVGQGTYLYPSNCLFLKTIELNYSDTNSENYQTAQQVDVANLPMGASFSWLRKNADASSPQWDDRGDSFEIFPTPTSTHNVSQMMRIFYYLKPTEYTAVTDTIAYPPSLDYRTIGWRIVANYLKSLSRQEDAALAMTEYDIRVKQYIETLSRGSQQPIQSTPIQISGFEF